MKVVSIVGARPQFVKLAPISWAFQASEIDHVIIHTGQHYDSNMSDVFFEDLTIPRPDFNLEVGSATHGVQTGRMLAALDPILSSLRPNWVLVYGDTNSTLAGAVAAVKLNLKLAHLEAGLRTLNRSMPEEINRVLTDHASDLLLAPTETAMKFLKMEGLGDRSVLVGDVMVDICLEVAARVAGQKLPLPELGLRQGEYAIATIHRAENTDDPARLASLIDALHQLPLPTLLTAHPRLQVKASEAGIALAGGSVRVVDPLPYPMMIQLVSNARHVVTDSGGLQKEAYILGVPCSTLIEAEIWPETLHDGWNEICTDLMDLSHRVLFEPIGNRSEAFGRGTAAELVVRYLKERYGSTRD